MKVTPSPGQPLNALNEPPKVYQTDNSNVLTSELASEGESVTVSGRPIGGVFVFGIIALVLYFLSKK